jgi:transcriptional regulator with XRE-family HTH domain
MEGKRRGRPSNPLNPDASHAAWFGAELRKRREDEDLTLEAFSTRIDYSPQHISQAERAKAPVSARFVAACDHALRAQGALVDLYPATFFERAAHRHERSSARAGQPPTLRWTGPPSDAGDDVQPTNRRGLIEAGTGTALGALSVTASPAAASDIDPELPTFWDQLLSLLGRHDAACGPTEVLGPVRHQITMIAAHRKIARGELHHRLLCEEARWCTFAAWLSNDAGQLRDRDAWTDRALRLARQARDPDTEALARARQSQWATQDLNAHQAIAFAEDALRIPDTNAQTRAFCALRAAFGHAIAHDATACEHALADAHQLAEQVQSPAPPWAGDFRITHLDTRAAEARCWLWLQPHKAIGLYEDVLRNWPRNRMRTAGLHRARLALACATTGEHDRAHAEARRAMAIARSTKSSLAKRELKRVGQILRTT